MRMRSGKIVAICGGLILAVLLVQCMAVAAQTVHVVGDGDGWTVPSGGASFYSNWASPKTFVVGDSLTFNFGTNRHDVVKVPKASFDRCSSDNAIETITTGPANVSLAAAGDHFFICTIGTHCTNGQKLAITVSESTTAHSPTSPEICPPEASPPPLDGGPNSGSSPPPPPPPSGSSVLAASFLSVFSVCVSFLFL